MGLFNLGPNRIARGHGADTPWWQLQGEEPFDNKPEVQRRIRTTFFAIAGVILLAVGVLVLVRGDGGTAGAVALIACGLVSGAVACTPALMKSPPQDPRPTGGRRDQAR